MSKIYITGVSGTGKSTLAAELINRGVAAFDMDAVDDLCDWRHKKTREPGTYEYGIGAEWLDEHEYVCDQKKLEQLINAPKGNVAVLGVVSNQDELLPLFDKVFLLCCKEETFLHRLDTRDGDNQFAKDKSEQEHILSWYKGFEKKMLEQGAIPISTEDPIDKVADKIMAETDPVKTF